MKLTNRLFTVENKKISKAKDFGYLQIGLHLVPYNISGYNVCKFATKSCKEVCLNFSGNGGLSKVQQSRLNKTKYFFEDRDNFMRLLDAEIYFYKKLATIDNKKLCVRLNLTSDIDFQQIYIDDKTLFEKHSDIQFLDYTKDYNRISFFNNYDLIYSYDQVRHKKALDILKRGDKLAVVFEKEKPKLFEGFNVVDGDIHDLIFLQPKNSVLGLKYKNVVMKGVNNKELKVKNTLVVKKDNEFNKININLEW